MSTREKLLAVTIEVLTGPGIAALSARSVAAVAGVYQALIFYHFDSVPALVADASRMATRETVTRHRAAFARAASLTELFEVGRELHAEESDRGTVRVMGELLAAGQSDEQYAAPVRECLEMWFAEVTTAVDRLLARSPLRPLIEVAGLSRAIGSAFLGLELYEGVDPDGAARVMDSVAALGALLDVLDDLGPIERKTGGRSAQGRSPLTRIRPARRTGLSTAGGRYQT